MYLTLHNYMALSNASRFGQPCCAHGLPADRADAASSAAEVRHGAWRIRDLSSMFPPTWNEGGECLLGRYGRAATG